MVLRFVNLLILVKLGSNYNSEDIGLYRDNRLSVFKDVGPESERIKKNIRIFKDLDLQITIKSNLKMVNYLDVTLDLKTEKYYPYKKPNDELLYINRHSNHPPNIVKHLPESIVNRLSALSYDEEVFNKAKTPYQNALKSCGYDEELVYTENNWFNPLYSKNVETNIGRSFLNQVKRHFPSNHKYHKLFNKNNVKVSYRCMSNMENKI